MVKIQDPGEQRRQWRRVIVEQVIDRLATKGSSGGHTALVSVAEIDDETTDIEFRYDYPITTAPHGGVFYEMSRVWVSVRIPAELADSVPIEVRP